MTTDRYVTPTKIVQVPESLLLGPDEKPIVADDILEVVGTGGRQVKVLSITADAEGNILVQENFRISPDMIGCRYQEPRVLIDMAPEDARGLLAFYAMHSDTDQVGEQTHSFARPVFAELEGELAQEPIEETATFSQMLAGAGEDEEPPKITRRQRHAIAQEPEE
jgi:hypothetical protein